MSIQQMRTILGYPLFILSNSILSTFHFYPISKSKSLKVLWHAFKVNSINFYVKSQELSHARPSYCSVRSNYFVEINRNNNLRNVQELHFPIFPNYPLLTNQKKWKMKNQYFSAAHKSICLYQKTENHVVKVK